MTRGTGQFEVRLASGQAELHAVQKLRYRVFVQELGASGALANQAEGIEKDGYDAHCDHLVLIDKLRAGETAAQIVGVYRLMGQAGAEMAGQYYSESEFDLGPLRASGRTMLELGRSCVLPEYRSGLAMFHLWKGLAAIVAAKGVEILFGVASFHGTDIAGLSPSLSMLHHRHLAPRALRACAKTGADPADWLRPLNQIDRRAAMVQVPALIKAYLRLGGYIGEGVYVDYVFNTTDVFMVVDMAGINEKQKTLYSQSIEGQR